MTRTAATRRAGAALLLGASSALSLSAVACARTHASPAPRAVRAITAMPPAPGERPSDAEIAAIFLAANNTDVSYARLARSRTQSTAVEQFAERMLTDHAALNKSMNDLLSTLPLSPEDDSTSLHFRDESSDERDILRALDGHAFDTAYMANEVRYHTTFLASLDDVLIPSARNVHLKLLLVSVRPAVAAHLAHAEQTRAAVLAHP